MEVIGRIKVIGPNQDINPTFRKRELVITTEEQYPQTLMIEFVQDRTDLLNNFQVGQPVRVSINLRGREWVNPEGETRYFNSIQGWRIEPWQAQQPQQGYGQPANYGGYPPQGQPQQPAQPQQQYGGGQQFAQNTQPNMPNPNNPFPPAPSQTNEEEPDDLPF